MEEYTDKLEELRDSIEDIFLKKGFTMTLVHLKDWYRPLNCELNLYGVTKTGANGHVLLRFDIKTNIVAYAQGNRVIVEWLIEKYFIKPNHDYYSFRDSIYK